MIDVRGSVKVCADPVADKNGNNAKSKLLSVPENFGPDGSERPTWTTGLYPDVTAVLGDLIKRSQHLV